MIRASVTLLDEVHQRASECVYSVSHKSEMSKKNKSSGTILRFGAIGLPRKVPDAAVSLAFSGQLSDVAIKLGC
eukprot:TRINITY_DN8301_c0_g1_i1.p1 TRINITY_DN8301_c0_g1~~TRINITY_DN8301_c0_g1_i1.p1  ORF type:complete len:74 (+),score=5.94 TRINITY_DN8301_c0_g1_i1:193-414(+)